MSQDTRYVVNKTYVYLFQNRADCINVANLYTKRYGCQHNATRIDTHECFGWIVKSVAGAYYDTHGKLDDEVAAIFNAG